MPHPKFLIAGVLILGAISYLMFSGIGGSVVYYYTVSELTAKAPEIGERGVRLSGHVLSGSIKRDDSLSRVEFLVEEKATARTMRVAYRGIVPDTFKDGAEVVVEGTFDPDKNLFAAHNLLAKCPSKYEGKQEGGDTVDSGPTSGETSAATE